MRSRVGLSYRLVGRLDKVIKFTRFGGDMKAYEVITDRFIEILESGVSPWRQPWASRKVGFAKNMVSGKDYRGINFFTTNYSSYDSSLWGTYKQISSLGGQVKKGEKGTPIVFYTLLEKEGKEGEDNKSIPFLKYSYVFNAMQCEGLRVEEEVHVERYEHSAIEECEGLILGIPLGFSTILHGGDRAFYRPITDTITLPHKSLFPRVEDYYATYFHEAVHATGHVSRLHREGVEGCSYFGSSVYSKEELIAELGSAFLCAAGGIDDRTMDNSASYLNGWIRLLKENPRILLQSASCAQRAVDYLRGTV